MKFILLLKIIIGFMALLLGAVGIFIPVLPTTPFVLLAVGCFSSTPVIQGRILKIPLIKEYYESYHQGTGIQGRTVFVSLTFLWSMLLISAVVAAQVFITLILALIGIAVTLHIFYLANK